MSESKNEEDVKEAFVVSINSDLTEGKGYRVVEAICEIETTAIRLAKGADVQGTDGSVEKILLYHPEKENIHWRTWWYGPINLVRPNLADKEMQKSIHEARAKTSAARRAVAKARELGLTDAEIQAIADSSSDEPA
jgi:hypothetical protein